MKTLIQRELRELNLARNYDNSTRAFLSVYGILGIGFPVILWLLGPGIAGIFDAEVFNTSVSVTGMVLVWQTVSGSLQREDANRQLTFLQTLPVEKRHIVNAKFTSVLLICLFTIAWMAIVMFLNVWISGIGTGETWLPVGFFASLIIFIAAMTLQTFFRWGARRLTMTPMIITIFIWGGVFTLLGFFMKRMGKEPGVFVFMIFMSLSLAIYLSCWWLSVRKVNKKGFPIDEGYKTEWMNAFESLEEGGAK
ncbi:ABC-2 transporter permease [Lentibacillus juripiscarius]|uniref:ABC-2 transporter permease n=1 Tax=Lentibacillus juripiscarius TaxID=257446 RepID=A0ABW5V4U9_9BACI